MLCIHKAPGLWPRTKAEVFTSPWSISVNSLHYMMHTPKTSLASCPLRSPAHSHCLDVDPGAQLFRLRRCLSRRPAGSGALRVPERVPSAGTQWFQPLLQPLPFSSVVSEVRNGTGAPFDVLDWSGCLLLNHHRPWGLCHWSSQSTIPTER